MAECACVAPAYPHWVQPSLVHGETASDFSVKNWQIFGVAYERGRQPYVYFRVGEDAWQDNQYRSDESHAFHEYEEFDGATVPAPASHYRLYRAARW